MQWMPWVCSWSWVDFVPSTSNLHGDEVVANNRSRRLNTNPGGWAMGQRLVEMKKADTSCPYGTQVKHTVTQGWPWSVPHYAFIHWLLIITLNKYMIFIICVFWGQGGYSQFGLDHVVPKTKLRLVACKASALSPVLTLRTGSHFFSSSWKINTKNPCWKNWYWD